MTGTKEVFREELVLLNYNAKDAEDVLKALADRLFDDGSVKETYYEAMLNREKSYPTGLPTEGIKVAIPHAEVDHVNYSAFAIATLPKPVKFGEMGAGPESTLDVQIVMMLANADPDEQVKTLRKMVDLFDEPDSLYAIMGAKTPKEIINIMKENYEEDE
jgi:PTS system galactitol-specific IIA component